MRLILSSSLPSLPLPEPPPETYGFYCAEDFTVGPRAHWGEPERFRAERAEYWARSDAYGPPDGAERIYYVWNQFAPHISLEDYVALIETEQDPAFHDAEDLFPLAESIEIWVDPSVHAQTCLWFSLAEFGRRGVAREKFRLCRFARAGANCSDAEWAALLSDAPDRPLPAEPITEAEWQRAQALWQAVTALPRRPDPALLHDAGTAQCFARLAGRFADPLTGLNALQRRLLRGTHPDWRHMARVVGDAMAAGYRQGDPVGDAVLKFELEAMATLTPPPVEIDGTGAMRFCKLRLTEAGEALRDTLGPED